LYHKKLQNRFKKLAELQVVQVQKVHRKRPQTELGSRQNREEEEEGEEEEAERWSGRTEGARA
jgi:hypothetical protein